MDNLHKVLDVFAKRCCPVPETPGLSYTWTVQQIEYKADIMFKQPCDLEPLYDGTVRTAVFTVKPDNIATFLGQRITYNCKNEVGTFRVKRQVQHRDDSSTEHKDPLKKSIYSLYQLFTIMKAANYRYLEFILSFDDHSNGKENLTKVTSPSAMSRIFKRLRLHGIIERAKGTYKYFVTAYGKEIIAAGLTVRNLMRVPALA